MQIQKLIYEGERFVKRNSSTILSIIGAFGVGVTAVMAAKAAPKAIDIIEAAEEERGRELTKTEKVIVTAPIYAPAVLMGMSTIACIFGANVISKKHQAALTSAYTMLSSSYSNYRNKVIELYGEDTDDNIRKAIAMDNYVSTLHPLDDDEEDDLMLFYDYFSNRYFETTMERVKDAEYHFNRNLAIRGWACLNEFYEFLDIPKVDYGDDIGWSLDIGPIEYGYSWVDFEHKLVEMEDGLQCMNLYFPFEPTADCMY